MTFEMIAAIATAEFLAGVAVGVFFKDKIVAAVLAVTNFPAKAWQGFKDAIGVKAKQVEGNLSSDVAALQAKVDAVFGKGLVAVTVAPVAKPAPAVDAPVVAMAPVVADVPAQPAAPTAPVVTNA